MARERRERGQGLVEFALVLPILIVLIVSVGELGLDLRQAAQPGLRVARGGPHGRRAGTGKGIGLHPDQPGPVPRGCHPRRCRAAHPHLSRLGHQPCQDPVGQHLQGDEHGRRDGQLGELLAVQGDGFGTHIDPGPGEELIDFRPRSTVWPACDRNNGGPSGFDFDRGHRQIHLRLRDPAPGAAQRHLRRGPLAHPDRDDGHGAEPHPLGDPVNALRTLTTAGGRWLRHRRRPAAEDAPRRSVARCWPSSRSCPSSC